jgi:hypothetical protein
LEHHRQKRKKQIAEKITKAVMHDYDFSTQLDIPVEALTGITEQTQFDDIIGLDEVGKMVTEYESRKLNSLKKFKKLQVNIKNPILKYIDELLEDKIINRLLSYKGYTPNKRD